MSQTVTPVITETRRKNESSVCSQKPQEGLLRDKRNSQSLGIVVVLQHRGMGSEYRSFGERALHHSGNSSPRFPKHKKQLQRKFVN
jgi:hypothetical protein